jgi:hypothetical protein
MKTGDVSRARRLADPARRRWYAHHRAIRFAIRMGESIGGPLGEPLVRSVVWASLAVRPFTGVQARAGQHSAECS